jgi:hypothetical protein
MNAGATQAGVTHAGATRVGWYVHHHGRGHVGRLLAIAPHVAAEILCFSSLPQPENLPANCTWILLDPDNTEEPSTGGPLQDRDTDAGGLLHWAPVHHTGHRRRLTTIATTIEHSPVSAFVVDVSAEVSLFVRLLGVPTVLITQPGERTDIPHHLAFRSATKILAPWPGELLRPAHLDDYATVVYVGGISRFEDRATRETSGVGSGSDTGEGTGSDDPTARVRSGVLVLGGAGGTDVTAESITAAAAATPEFAWTALGVPGHGDGAWSADPWDDLRHAEIVIAWAGQNSVADLAAANVNAIVIPQSRPFAEQVQTAEALGLAGLAVVEPSWPSADAWPGLLARALTLQPEWSRWRTAGAAERAAAEIIAVAHGVENGLDS